MLKQIIRTSNPSLSLFTFGPYLLGIIAGLGLVNNVHPLLAILWGFYFLIPANVWVHALQEWFNMPISSGILLQASWPDILKNHPHRHLLIAILITHIPYGIALFFTPFTAAIPILAFLILTFFFCAPPVRAKERPLLDVLFSAAYVFPGLAGFALAGGTSYQLPIILAAVSWWFATYMITKTQTLTHDQELHMPTVATFFGYTKTVLLSAVCYLAAGMLAFPSMPLISLSFTAWYLILICILIKKYAPPSARMFDALIASTHLSLGIAILSYWFWFHVT